MDRESHAMIFDASTPWRLLVKLSVPSVITTMIMLVYNLADVFFIGQLGDKMQMAAVSLCAPMFSLLSGVGMLFGHGSCIRCATLLGERRYDEVRNISAFCFWGTVATGAVLTVGLFLAREPILSLLGASENTYAHANRYLTVMLLGIPLMLFSQAMSALLRADGQVKEPMYGNIIGSLTNIVLDPIFILVFRWGVQGAAIATVIANGVNCLWLLRLTHRKKSIFSMDPREIQFKWRLTGGVLLLGVPMMVNTLLTSFSGVLTNRFLVGYNDVLLAANGVSSKLRMIVNMLAMGVCMGIQPAISYFHGARRRDKLRDILKVTALTTTVIGVVLSILFYVFRDTVIRIFIDDPAVILYGSQMVLGAMISGPVQGIYQLCTSYLQATGSVSLSTLLAAARQAAQIPLLILGNTLFGFIGVIYSSSIATFLCVGLGLGLCLLWSRKLRKAEERAQPAQEVPQTPEEAPPA